MAIEKRDLLEVLKLELEFLKNGGYRQSSAWRPRLIFEDSPTCLNFGLPKDQRPCSECVLTSLVPEEHRHEQVPCRYIPITKNKQSIQSLYATETSAELEAHLAEWLMNIIQQLELEQGTNSDGGVNGTPKASARRA